MIDSLTSDNYRDFGPRYSGTYGWLLKDNKELFVYLDRVEDSKVYFRDGTKFPFYANADAGIKFKFIPVNKGWFNAADGQTYYLARRPARQWKRGIAPTNTQINRLDDFREMPVSWEVLSTIFGDNYHQLNYPKAFKGRSCAISKHFAVGADYTVYFYLQPIGSFNEDTNTFELQVELVSQELQDLINRNGWDFGVKIVND